MKKFLGIVLSIHLLLLSGYAQGLQDRDKNILESCRRVVAQLQILRDENSALARKLAEAEVISTNNKQITKEQSAYIASLEASYKNTQIALKQTEDYAKILDMNHKAEMKQARQELKSKKHEAKIWKIIGISAIAAAIVLGVSR